VTHRVEFAPAARLEVIEGFRWYEERAIGLGRLFEAEIDRQVARIAESALQFPEAAPNVRRARLRRFPYSLFFRIDADHTYVIACFHQSRDPRRWEGRS
jgi:toxin ParE1/3/4